MKINIVCDRCNSENILRDAWAEWNPETQKWELHSVYDHLRCDDCGFTDTIEVPYEEEL